MDGNDPFIEDDKPSVKDRMKNEYNLRNLAFYPREIFSDDSADLHDDKRGDQIEINLQNESKELRLNATLWGV